MLTDSQTLNNRIVYWCDRIIEYGIYGIIFFVPIVICPWVYFQFSVEKVFILQLFTLIILTAYLVKVFEKRKFIFNRTTLEIPVLIFFFVNILSTIFSIHPHFSLIGNYWRQEGLLKTTIWYIILYFLIVNNFKTEHISKLYLSIILSGWIVIIYSLLSLLGIEIVGIISKDRFILPSSERIVGTLGNPVFTGNYLAMLIPLAISLFLITKFYPRCFLLIFIIFAYIILLFTYSRGAYISLFFSLIIFGLLIGKRIVSKNKIWIIFLLVILGLTTYISFKISTQKRVSIAQRITSIANLKEEAISVRLLYWEGVLKVIPKYLFLGTGPETLPKVFPKKETIEIAQIYGRKIPLPDRVHNMYLQIAQSLGIIGLWAYLLLFITFLSKALYISKKLMRENEKLIIIGLIGCICGYLIQNFFSFEIVETSLVAWYCMSFCMVINSEKNKKYVKKFNPRLKPISYSLIFLFTMGALWLIIKIFIADVYFQQANIFIKEKEYKKALPKLNKAIYLNPTYSIYYNSLAKCHLKLGQLNKAEKILNKALKLEILPDFIYQNLAIVYLQQGDYKKGIHLLKKTLELNPTLIDSYSNLIQAYYRNGMTKEAISTGKKALEILPNNLQIRYDLLRIYYHEKRYREAIFICKEILKLSPYNEQIRELLRELQKRVSLDQEAP